MPSNDPAVRIVSVRFRNYKALADFQLRLKQSNILVGPNNAGKSTIIGAFRVLTIALRRMKGRKPDIVNGPNGRRYGAVIPSESLPISLENVHTDYSDEDTLVTFSLSNGNELQLFFPRDGACILIAENHGAPLLSSAAFQNAFPIQIAAVPILGPVEHKEELVQSETVQRNLLTHRASRNFRNYWYHFHDNFDEFSSLVRKTWPGSDVELPTMTDHVEGTLSMFCYESRILRELYWMGSGFQIWCQLLSHLIRAQKASLIVIDEPEVYLHADVQRQLIGLLKDLDSDVLLATHSTEIMGEVEPTDMVLIDKRNKAGERISNADKLQEALASVGSIHVITLSRLARSRRILFTEGDKDYKLTRMIARQLGYFALASGLEIVPAVSEGFGSWNRIIALQWGVEKAFGDRIEIGAMFDRDFFCDAQIADVEKELHNALGFSHIHGRKEIENYLLVPACLDRAIRSGLEDLKRREGAQSSVVDSIEGDLRTITENYKSEVQSQRISKEVEYRKTADKKRDASTLYSEAALNFEGRWATLGERLEIVPGKKVLADIRDLVRERHHISLPDSKIVAQMRAEDIPPDLANLLEKLEAFRSRPVGP